MRGKGRSPENKSFLVTCVLSDITAPRSRSIFRCVLNYLISLEKLPENLKEMVDEASTVLKIAQPNNDRRRRQVKEEEKSLRNKFVS